MMLPEVHLQFRRIIEIILYGPLAPAGDDDQVVNPGGDRFLNNILDDRPIDQGEHLLRHGLGGREKPGSKTCSRDDGLAHLRHQHTPS